MPLTNEAKVALSKIQNECLDVLDELSEVLPENYRLTLVARHETDGDYDIVLTNDVPDSAIESMERKKAELEQA